MKQVKYILVSFTDVSFRAADIPKLRGHFAKGFPDVHWSNTIHHPCIKVSD